MKKIVVYSSISLLLCSCAFESTKMDFQRDSNYEAVTAEVGLMLEEGIIDQKKRDELVEGYLEIPTDSLKQQAEYLEMIVKLRNK